MSLRVKAELDNLELLRNYASDSARRFGCSTQRVREVELAVEEALVNIFCHAYDDKEGEVMVSCRVIDDTLAIELCDWGKPFDPAKYHAPCTATAEARVIGGMGIPIAKRYADRMEYRRDGGRNILTLLFSCTDDGA